MTYKVVVNFNMFGTFIEYVIVDNLNSTLIVTVDWNGSIAVNSKIL